LISTGNATTDKLIGVSFSGNIIHGAWYKTIVKKNGKADIIAINILADVVYWYRPSEVRDEATGQVVGYKKKFKAELLQRTYDSYADQFGISKRQVQDAIKRLEELKVVKRVLKNITTENGMFLSNVLYLDLVFEKLYTVSFLDISDLSGRSPEKTWDVTQKNVGRVAENSVTYTKSTPKTSTNYKNKAFLPSKNGTLIVDNFSDKAKSIYKYFAEQYLLNIGEVHPTVNDIVVDRLNEIMDSEMIYDYDMERDLMIDEGAMTDMIDAYFKTDYPLKDGGYADHRIWHFLSDGVLKNLYYKELF